VGSVNPLWWWSVWLPVTPVLGGLCWCLLGLKTFISVCMAPLGVGTCVQFSCSWVWWTVCKRLLLVVSWMEPGETLFFKKKWRWLITSSLSRSAGYSGSMNILRVF
jgi:hypothetical protein